MAPAGTTGKGPAAFASVVGAGNRSIVFYVDDQKTIRAWQQPELGPESMYRDAPENPKTDREKQLAGKPYLWGRNPYNQPPVSSKEQKGIKTDSQDLGVVSLIEGGKNGSLYQIRIYYASDKKADPEGKSYLSELCLDLDPKTFAPTGQSKGSNDGKWYKGSLDGHKFEIKDGSSISAHVQLADESKDASIKVYYWPANPKASKEGYGAEDRPAIAWIALDYKDLWLSTESGI